MAGTFRIIALIFVVSPFAAMFSEPFFEAVFDIFGWDTESWAGPAAEGVLMVAASLGDPQVLQISTYLALVGVGVWLHYLASIRDRKRPQKADIFAEMSGRISGMASELENLRGHWVYYTCPPAEKGKWSPDTAGMYMALENDLRRIGVKIPKFQSACSGHNWNERVNAVISTLRVLQELSRQGQLKEAIDMASEFSLMFQSDFPRSN